MSAAPSQMELTSRLMVTLRLADQLGLREWAERHIYLPHDYPSYSRGCYYRADDYPFLFPIMAAIDLPTVRECVLIKSVQLGLSQNILIPAAMRALHRGDSILFATGLADQAETFRLERFLPLVRASNAFSALSVKDRETEIYCTNGGLLSFLHNSSRSKTKSRPARVVLADELDMFEWGVVQRLRGRVTRYNDSKIIMVSALDPDANRRANKQTGQTETPAIAEWNESSKGYWHLPDPKAPDGHRHKWFRLEFGFPDAGQLPTHGVMWDHKTCRRADGSVDEQRVHDTTRYVTPYGTELSDKQISELMPRGRHMDEIPQRAAAKPGLMLNCLYTPRKELASWVIEYLRVKAMGGAEYRVWMLERFCELPYMEKTDVTDRTIYALEFDYRRGDPWYESPNVLDALNPGREIRPMKGTDND